MKYFIEAPEGNRVGPYSLSEAVEKFGYSAAQFLQTMLRKFNALTAQVAMDKHSRAIQPNLNYERFLEQVAP